MEGEEGEVPTPHALPTVQFSLLKINTQYGTFCTGEGSVHQSASVLLNRVK
jgi:hypothetical protein